MIEQEMLSPTIASCREIQTSNEGTVIFATVFGDVPLLVFWRIPPMFRKYIERKIELIIEHEQLHFILAREKLDTKSLDKIFPYVEDLEKWRKKQ